MEHFSKTARKQDFLYFFLFQTVFRHNWKSMSKEFLKNVSWPHGPVQSRKVKTKPRMFSIGLSRAGDMDIFLITSKFSSYLNVYLRGKAAIFIRLYPYFCLGLFLSPLPLASHPRE
jgi:hypothetical protein